jgi:hypothetical protein
MIDIKPGHLNSDDPETIMGRLSLQEWFHVKKQPSAP